MTINKEIIEKIENLLRVEEKAYNKAYKEKDRKTQNEVYERFDSMMKIVRIFGYDWTYDNDDGSTILHLKKIPEHF